MYSVNQKDAPCAGKLFLVWGVFGLGMAVVWGLAHGNPLVNAAIWGLGLLAAFGLLLGMRDV
jgi:FtsH-binding integral membrane protein